MLPRRDGHGAVAPISSHVAAAGLAEDLRQFLRLIKNPRGYCTVHHCGFGCYLLAFMGPRH